MKTFILENNFMCVTLSERGRILSILHKACGNIELIDSPYDASFFMNLMSEDCKEILVFEKDQEITAEGNAECASFHMDKLKTEYGFGKYRTADIALTLHVRLDGDSLLFTADVDNRTDLYIGDFEYPYVGVIKSLGNGKPAVFWPSAPGFIYFNAGEMLSDMGDHRTYGANCLSGSYPSLTCSMGTYALMDKESCLFITTEDPDFISCIMQIKGSPNNRGALTCTVDKHIFCQHTKMTTAPIRMRLFKGDWHYGAKKYAEWIYPHLPKHEIPDWVRKMSGYFLVINKQQFGYEMWDYDKLPELYELAKSYGFDTLGLFGWFHTGHDNNYPDIDVSPTLGGTELLKENIRKVQEAGGHVTLYHQAHLIDIMSDYYQSGKGKAVACINPWGEEYHEIWSKNHKSGLMCNYATRKFVNPCESCEDWINLMVEKEEWIASFGADAALFDQVGGMRPFPCFSKEHKHDGDNPGRATTGGNLKLMKTLQKRSKELGSSFSYFSECFADLYSSSLDAIHGCPNSPGGDGEHNLQIGEENRGRASFPDFLKYVFPELIMTGRNGEAFKNHRFTNYIFLYNFVLEYEIRYRNDCEELLNDLNKELRLYMASASALRGRYIDRLSRSTYTDTDGITNPDRLMLARGYAIGDEILVTFWNDSTKARTPDISVEGRRLVSFETLDGTVTDHLREIASQEVAIAVYR